jgi:methyl-accepting chemotaxis protein
MLSKLSIRKRIFFYIVLFLVLFSGTAFITQYFLVEYKNSEHLNHQVLSIKSTVQNLKIYENEILTKEIVNEDFYANQTGEYLIKFKSNYADLMMMIDESLSPGSQNIIDSLMVTDLVQSVEQYKLSFDTLTTKLLEKGFKDYGLIGDFRVSAHEAEDYINQLEDSRYHNLLLRMRRHEKDFLLRLDQRYVEKFNNVQEDFIIGLQELSDQQLAETLTSLITAYSNHFNMVVEAQMEISLPAIGLIQRVDVNFDNIFTELNSIVQRTEAHKDKMLINLRITLLALLGLASVLAIILMSGLSRTITKPVKSLEKKINRISTGNITDEMVDIRGNHEIARMGHSINKLIDGLKKTVGFAEDISNKKYDTNFQPLSENDTLGKSLLDMRENLVKAEKEAQDQREQEKQQNWINSGTARFADILNHNYSDTNEFAFNIISNLVKYLNATQGGMFMVNDEDPEDVHLELKSAFAYNRRKFLQKRVELGEGFVGTSVLEKSIIYRTEIPDDYISITSGLGEANPQVLLIIPLILENNYYGVIEIASFNEFKEYELEFIQKISETIASTISAVKSKERTEKLLEKTREQAEQITQTEEEMRQNVEELQATQEEMARKQDELEQRKQLMEDLLDTIPVPLFVKDDNKQYYLINQFEAELFMLPKDKIIGYTEKDILSDDISIRTADESDAKVLENGERVELLQQKIKLKDGTEKTFKTIKIPFHNKIADARYLLGISLESIDHDAEHSLKEAYAKIEQLTIQLQDLQSEESKS